MAPLRADLRSSKRAPARLSDIAFVSAGKRRDFCPLRLRVVRPRRTRAAIFVPCSIPGRHTPAGRTAFVQNALRRVCGGIGFVPAGYKLRAKAAVRLMLASWGRRPAVAVISHRLLGFPNGAKAPLALHSWLGAPGKSRAFCQRLTESGSARPGATHASHGRGRKATPRSDYERATRA